MAVAALFIHLHQPLPIPPVPPHSLTQPTPAPPLKYPVRFSTFHTDPLFSGQPECVREGKERGREKGKGEDEGREGRGWGKGAFSHPLYHTSAHFLNPQFFIHRPRAAFPPFSLHVCSGLTHTVVLPATHEVGGWRKLWLDWLEDRGGE